MKIIGIRSSTFTAKETGEVVSGLNIYMTEPMTKGDGESAERIFVTSDKVARWGYSPAVGDEVAVTYNRYGKVDTMRKVATK